MNNPDVSIIILAKNEAETIGKCLSGVFNQKTNYKFEVIVIDSGSTDGTISIAQRYPVKIIHIKPEEFGHGKTRNLGARLSKGKFLVYLTADAIPYNEYWLESLLKNFKDKNLAGAYSRWIPRENCPLLERRYIYENFPPVKKIYTNKILQKFVPFSNVSSCIRKDIWNEIKFEETAIFGEDYKWATKAVKKGYAILYEPDSIVIHSHHYTLKGIWRRGILIGVDSRGYMHRDLWKLPLIPFRALYHTYKDFKFAKKNKINTNFKEIFSSYILHLSGFFGQWLGRNFPAIYFRVFKKGVKWQGS